MSGLKNNPREHEDAIYASILADGKIHVGVSEDTEGAVARYYATDADKEEGKDTKSGVKHELLYTELSGMIADKGISFHEGNYGKNLLIKVEIEGEEKPVVLSLSTESNYGEDVMKKLPNIDLKKEVKFAPYSFEDKGKKKRGITVTQLNKKKEEEKVGNYYFDADKKAPLHGYPALPKPKVKGKAIGKSEWRKHFADAREFLIEATVEHFGIEDEESQADKDYNNLD